MQRQQQAASGMSGASSAPMPRRNVRSIIPDSSSEEEEEEEDASPDGYEGGGRRRPNAARGGRLCPPSGLAARSVAGRRAGLGGSGVSPGSPLVRQAGRFSTGSDGRDSSARSSNTSIDDQPFELR